jgi:hypothetical protein
MRIIQVSMATISMIVGGCSARTNTRVAGDPRFGDVQTAIGAKEIPSFRRISTRKRPV